LNPLCSSSPKILRGRIFRREMVAEKRRSQGVEVLHNQGIIDHWFTTSANAVYAPFYVNSIKQNIAVIIYYFPSFFFYILSKQKVFYKNF
jgi:hypothetical protein